MTVFFSRNLPSCNFLVCACDDEITRVHRDDISCELAGKVILRIQFLPLHIRILILGFLKSVSYSTLVS